MLSADRLSVEWKKAGGLSSMVQRQLACDYADRVVEILSLELSRDILAPAMHCLQCSKSYLSGKLTLEDLESLFSEAKKYYSHIKSDRSVCRVGSGDRHKLETYIGYSISWTAYRDSLVCIRLTQWNILSALEMDGCNDLSEQMLLWQSGHLAATCSKIGEIADA